MTKCGVNNNRGCHGCLELPINIEANNLPLETLKESKDYHNIWIKCLGSSGHNSGWMLGEVSMLTKGKLTLIVMICM